MPMFKRKVLYLGGFDPRGARFYHWLASEQVGSGDAEPVTMSARRRIKPPEAGQGNVGWRTEARDGSFATDTEFLVWDDVVRQHWIKGVWPLLASGARAYVNFVGQIDWPMSRPIPFGSKFTLFYPGGTMTLVPLLITLLLGSLLWLVMPAWASYPLAGAAGVAATPFILRRIHSLWLMRFIIFNDLLARNATGPALEERLERFVDRIDATLDEPEWDEILFLTHSNGSMLAVPIMAALLKRRGGVLPERFKMVTLGGMIQLVACRRDSARFRAELDIIAAADFRWLDMGSPTDGACIPLIDPCIGRPASPSGLVQISPRWFRYADPATYHAERRNKYETHFNYLRRLQRPSPLDYIGITCGDRPLDASIAAFKDENGLADHD